MNCKPGDLAITVGSMRGDQDGRLVEVLRASTPQDVEEWEPGAWYVRVLGGPLYMHAANGKRPFTYCSLRDRNLRPIRDPGDDAVDETLQRLPAPKRDEVAA